ncbi:hypothetical protein [Xenorhabdus bovienii]|uniref:Uncharacterized protein n=1 Tax=Xenorhabdus bovienii str. feltiae Moldova TaxID=1398200 RepID=A0A077NRS8_XENBV|nr:hypothetical protein [Xenorhabdus bovienii]CDH01239.1 hypothetical protein XBFM1_2050007 [Xenorhabdus bovienii str. feltiae Moldova]
MANNITISPASKSKIIVGQLITANITFESDILMSANISFELTNLINLTISNTDISVLGNSKSYTATTKFHISENINEGDTVSFLIKPNVHAIALGFKEQEISYFTYDVDRHSLNIHFDQTVVLALTTDEPNIPPNGQSYSLATALVTDSKGNPLAGEPITIIGGFAANLDKVRIFSSNNNIQSEIQKKSLYGQSSIDINTDKYGKLEFYVYPSDKSQFVFDLQARITDATQFVHSEDRLYILNDDQGDPFNADQQTLAPPDILERQGDKLAESDGASTFTALIDNYEGESENDSILFFVGGKYAHQQFLMGKKKYNHGYTFQLPYSILPLNKYAGFSYVIVTVDGNLNFSAGMDIMYNGGSKNQPLDNVPRVYDMCTVYSSFGYSNASDLVLYNDMVNCFTISRHLNTNLNAGLYVAITGTNDPTDKTKVPLGSEVTLTLYIDSYKKKTNQIFKIRMPTQPDKDSKNIATYITPIPYKYVNDVVTFPNGAAGSIYFDYQVNESGKISYGNIWMASIDTTLCIDPDD